MTVTSAGRSTGNSKIGKNGAGDGQGKERKQAVDAAIMSIEKQFGQGSIMRRRVTWWWQSMILRIPPKEI